MRVLLLALIVFMMAGLSLAMTRVDLSSFGKRYLPNPSPNLAFEVEAEAVKTSRNVTVLRARPDGVMLLSGAARAQTGHYVLPRDAGLISGILNLNAAVQVSDDQHSLLRVFVGNQVRGEVLLRPGQHDISSEIGLTADDLAGETVAVRFVLVTSEEEEGACTRGATYPSIIEIEQTSSLVLEVQDFFLTPRDEVAAMGNEVLIGWPAWLSEQQRDYRWLSAASLVQRGFEVRFVDAPDSMTVSGNALEDLVASVEAPFILDDVDPDWPEYLATVGGNAGKRTFKESVAWRHWYRIGPDDHVTEPGALAYELMLGPLPGNSQWTVIATHNGSIIDTETVPGGIGMFEREISLENVSIEPSNLIEITATSDYEPNGLCNNGPELFAELRPNTRLIGGGAEFHNNVTAVAGQLSQHRTVTVALPDGMSLVEAQRMLDLTAELALQDKDIRLVEADAMVTGMRRAAIATIDQTYPDSSFFVWFDDTDRIVAQTIAALDDAEIDQPEGAIAIVVASIGEFQQTSLQIK